MFSAYSYVLWGCQSYIAYELPEYISFLYVIPCVLIALTFHEFSHGFAACRLGDPTARSFGRLTLNPLKHLDILGTICMIFFHFGWAKPVPINTRYFKKPRRDMAITALAGPIMNLILAFLGVLLFRIMCAAIDMNPFLSHDTSFWIPVLRSCYILIYYFFSLNISLAVFNLIPIPPLDGSRLLMIALPPRAYMWVAQNERYIMLALLVLLWTGILSFPLSYLVNLIFKGMNYLIGLIPFL